MTWWVKFNRRHPFIPNGLSLFRGAIGASLVFLLLSPARSFHLIAASLFALGVVTDYWDGWLARQYHHESDFGKIMDPTMDKILILVPLAIFSNLEIHSVWLVVPIFIREIVVTFCRIGWLLEGKAAGAEKLGKFKFAFQVGAVGLGFVYLIGMDFSFAARILFLLREIVMSALLIAMVLTVISGLTFLGSNRVHLKSVAFARFTGAVGVGLFPFIPGTLGSIAGVFLVLLVFWNPWLYWGTFVFLLWIGQQAVSRLDLSVVKDPQFVVIDEVLGIFVTFAGIHLNVYSALAGFFLFRVFDIIKPFPTRLFEKLPGYWGILCDDLCAGFYAWLVIWWIF